MNKKHTKIILQLISLSLIAGLALGLREYASHQMIADFDEPFYFNLSLKYANAIREGQYKQVAWIRDNAEHPVLAKLVYAAVLVVEPRVEHLYKKDLNMLYPVSEEAFPIVLGVRRLAEFFGVLTVIVLSLLNPLAGFMLAIQNTAIHYTSVIYLESLPALMSTCAVLSYILYRKSFDPKRRMKLIDKSTVWFFTSAIFLGLTAAGKYVFSLVGLAILIDYFWFNYQNKENWKTNIGTIFAWIILALLTFFVANPILWPKPLDRLIYSLQYHLNYSHSSDVTKYNYPFWQPFVWLVKQDKRYHNAFLFNPDAVILVLAILGLPATFKKYRVMFIWLVMALAFLLIWDTKWPQYIMMLVTPLCLSAGLALQRILKFLWKITIKKKDDLKTISS